MKLKIKSPTQNRKNKSITVNKHTLKFHKEKKLKQGVQNHK